MDRTVTVDVPATLEVALPSAAGEGSATIDTADIPGHIIATLIAFAIKQKWDHKVAGFIKAGKSHREGREACDEVLNQLTAGTWAKRGGPRVTTFDAYLEREATKAAKARIKTDAKLKDAPLEKVIAAFKANAGWVAKRRAEWDARGEQVELEIDL